MNFPYGYIIKTDPPENSFLVYGELKKCNTSFVSKGYKILAPNLTHAGNVLKNNLHMSLQGYLQRIDGKRVQFKFERDSDYSNMYNKYVADTEKYADQKSFCRYIREMKAKEIKRKIEDKDLLRDYLYIYISKPLKDFLPADFNPDHPEKFESTVAEYYKTEYISLRQSFGLEIKPLDHINLYKHFYRSVNKSAIENQSFDYAKSYKEIFEDIYENDYSGITLNLGKKNVCFVGDGYYHNVLTLNDLPSFPLFPFYGNSFLAGSIANMTITVNLEAKNAKETIEKKQKHLLRLNMDVKADPSEVALAAEADVEKKNIENLSYGIDKPYRCEFIFHLWNKDQSQLLSDTALLRQIATNMQAPLYMHELGTQSLDAFRKTLPGNLYYKDWGDALETIHRSLAAMIPFNSSFVGIAEFQAIFDGDHNNLVGIGLFQDKTPQHFVMFGQSGAGKSVDILGYLLQTFCFYKKIVIIEEGASYLMLTRIFGGQYIEIDANSTLTLNYFDTCGIPLTAQQIEFVSNFLTAMCGQSNDLDKIEARSAIISHYIAKAYNNAFYAWKKEHDEELTEIAKIALTIEFFLPKQPLTRSTPLDTFFDIRDALAKNEDERDIVEQEIVAYYNTLQESKIDEYIIDNSTLLRDVAYAYMSREDMPYHSQLVEMIRSTPDPSHKRDDTDHIATLLAKYAIESGQNTMFDGYTNIDLSNKLIHIELGKMGTASETIKCLVGLVINNFVKNQITNMPRADMKLYIIEEAQRIIVLMPGGGNLIKQLYAQLRKYGCVAGTISQEAGQLAESNVGNLIMGQSKQYFFLKNKDRKNLDYFTQYAKLSDDTIQTIMEFPSPDTIIGKKYSSFVYYVDNGEFPHVGVVRFFATEIEIAVASTSGTAFTRREAEIRKLSIADPNMRYGDLLLLYVKRESINNKAYQLICQMIASEDYGKINALKEAIINLSLEKQEEKRSEVCSSI